MSRIVDIVVAFAVTFAALIFCLALAAAWVNICAGKR